MSLVRSIRDRCRFYLSGAVRRFTHRIFQDAAGQTRLGVFGDDPSCPRWVRLYLGDQAQGPVRRRLNGPDWQARAQEIADQHGLSILYNWRRASPRFQSRLLQFYRHVPLMIDLGETEAEFLAGLGGEARRNLRKSQQHGFEMELVRDPQWAVEFDNRYQRPSISARHGAEAVFSPIEKMRKLIRQGRGEFVCVCREGRRLAAFFCSYSNSSYECHSDGWLDGDPELLKLGVIGAGFGYRFDRARQLGCRRVTQGGTPAVLEDGLFIFKSKWNSALNPGGWDWPRFGLLINPAHPHVQRMFHRHSLILRNPQGGYMVLSGKSPDQIRSRPALLRSLSAWFRLLPEPLDARPADNHPLPEDLRHWAKREL